VVGSRRSRGCIFVDFATVRLARSTFVPYSEHFVDFTGRERVKSTKCCLIAHRTLTFPTQPGLTFAGTTTHA
jgi:hypothetical protein